jgi:hypothetical protein
MLSAIEFRLNGRTVRVKDVSPNTTLLEYLRGAGLTGAKEGCAARARWQSWTAIRRAGLATGPSIVAWFLCA